MVLIPLDAPLRVEESTGFVDSSGESLFAKGRRGFAVGTGTGAGGGLGMSKESR